MSGARGSRRRAAASLLVMALLAVAACASDNPGDDAAPGSSTTTASTGSTTTASTSTSTTASTSTTTTTTAPVIEQGDLQAGSEGPRTRLLQAKLRDLKFDPGPIDGKFGAKTTMAVWAYQALTGTARNGVVDAMLEAHIAQAQPPPMLRPDLGPTHTEVDLDRQVMLVFRDNALQLVTHVLTGTGKSYCENGRCGVAVTPPGEFRYQRRITGWRHAPLGRLYNPVYFNGGIAVHGAPSVPDHPASHGCVRIPMHIAEYFQGLVANGEPISVFNGGAGAATAIAPPAPGATPPAPPDTLAGG